MDRQSRELAPLRLAAAVFGGLLMVLLALLALQVVHFDDPAPTLLFTADQLQLSQGRGERSENGLIIRQPGPGQTSIVLARLPTGVLAERYGRAGWHLEGVPNGHQMGLIWTTAADPRRARMLAFGKAERQLGTVDLTGRDGWEGQISAFGIWIRGTSDAPVSITQLSLSQAPFSMTHALTTVMSGWMHREPWSMRSINFRESVADDPLTAPLVQTALWCMIAFALLLALSLRGRSSRIFTAAAAIVVAAWLALDLQWQWQLFGRLLDTQEHYAGSRPSDRAHLGLDQSLLQLAKRIQAIMPDDPRRIFIVTSDPGGYVPLRMRYHLLPENTHPGMTSLPRREQVTPGDFLLLLSAPTEMHYSQATHQLTQDTLTLSADLLLRINGADGLYRVRTQ